MKLRPWRLSQILTGTRTVGEIAFRFNGSMVDIWIRVNGSLAWFAVDALQLRDFLAEYDRDSWPEIQGKETVLWAHSDGNAEEGQ